MIEQLTGLPAHTAGFKLSGKRVTRDSSFDKFAQNDG